MICARRIIAADTTDTTKKDTADIAVSDTLTLPFSVQAQEAQGAQNEKARAAESAQVDRVAVMPYIRRASLSFLCPYYTTVRRRCQGVFCVYRVKSEKTPNYLHSVEKGL